MNLYVSTVILALPLLISCQNPIRHWTLLPNILVVDVDGRVGQQALSCLELLEEDMRGDNRSQEIFWRRNGKEQAQRGNSFLVQLEESTGGGNYTCHSKNGSLLNHTVVLIQKYGTKRILVKHDPEDYLKCSTQNYSGEFHCSWIWDSSRVGKVAFIKAQRSDNGDAHCSVDTQERWLCSTGQSNFSCSVSESGDGISCLEGNYCPYAEENQQIHISVYVKSEQFLLENYSKGFYLSEIVKPDKVRIGKVNATAIEWSYPSSWSSPYSYFPLTFDIIQLRGRCHNCDNPCTQSKTLKTSTVHSAAICQFEVKRRAKAVCVRAKDAFCNSQWSEWSHIRLNQKKCEAGLHGSVVVSTLTSKRDYPLYESSRGSFCVESASSSQRLRGGRRKNKTSKERNKQQA
ncbi:interleukin-12 subunit beta-like isoform X2 [Salarias fasciatus]|uniref:interleukin-12 subunit beta-like isoform X2 n=1 Tax=Salarias fasciatus TaxID=181472 RepID=UPI001176E699|nr:interleukin-12 subunit beta-like isoform X2 [Salarias fasciatus]